MRLRPAPLLLATLLVLAGCSTGSDERPSDAGRAGSAATTAPVERTPPSEDELRWVARLETWYRSLAESVETAAGASMPLARGNRLRPDGRATLVRALRATRRCTERLDATVGEAPTARLREVEGLIRDACERFESGATAGLAVVAEPSNRDAGEDWGSEWEAGGRLLASARDVFADFSPSNSRRLPVRRGRTSATRVEPVLSRAADRAAIPAGTTAEGKPLEVRCWARRDWVDLLRRMNRYSTVRYPSTTLGVTGVGDYRVNLAQDVCDALVEVVYERARPADAAAQLRLADALTVLAHEAQHARGVVNEAVATCYGLQRTAGLARSLGVGRAYAAQLATLYWTEIYPRNVARYRSPECRSGGALDAFPDRAAWP